MQTQPASPLTVSANYGGRIRQKGAPAEGPADRDHAGIEQHQKGEGDYRTTLETLISAASRAAELFERSKTEQKR